MQDDAAAGARRARPALHQRRRFASINAAALALAKRTINCAALAFVDGGKQAMHTEAEQQLWNGCSRLDRERQAAGNKDTMVLVARMSSVAWRHVNLFGAIDFGAAAPVHIGARASYHNNASTGPAHSR